MAKMLFTIKLGNVDHLAWQLGVLVNLQLRGYVHLSNTAIKCLETISVSFRLIEHLGTDPPPPISLSVHFSFFLESIVLSTHSHCFPFFFFFLFSILKAKFFSLSCTLIGPSVPRTQIQKELKMYLQIRGKILYWGCNSTQLAVPTIVLYSNCSPS